MSHYVRVYNPNLKTEFYIKTENSMYCGTIIHVICNVREPNLTVGSYDFFMGEFCSFVTDNSIILMLDKITIFQ